MNAEEKRAFLLAQIADLKSRKPEGWQKAARELVKELSRLHYAYWEHEYCGTERLGRETHVDRSPTYDKDDDE